MDYPWMDGWCVAVMFKRANRCYMKGKAWGWELVLGGSGVFIQNWFGYHPVLSLSLSQRIGQVPSRGTPKLILTCHDVGNWFLRN
jgi:hypothetical protein